MDRFQEMAVFEAVGRLAGFSAAARAFGISTPAVTRTIAALEARLGVLLVHRTTRRVSLTEAGERFHRDCLRLLADVRNAEDAALGVHAEPRGDVVITAPILFGRLHVTPVLIELAHLHPQLVIHTRYLDRPVRLVDEGVDLAVRIGPLEDSTMRAATVGRIRKVVVAAPRYLRARRVPKRPDALVGHRLIAFDSLEQGHAWTFEKDDERVLVPMEGPFVTNTADVAVDACLAGLGITRVLHYQVADALRRGRLRTLLDAWEPEPLPVHVLHHEGRGVSGKVRACFDVLRDRLRANRALRA